MSKQIFKSIVISFSLLLIWGVTQSPIQPAVVFAQEPDIETQSFSDLKPVSCPSCEPWRANAKLFLEFKGQNEPTVTAGCSGALIDPKHLLTAGHCVYSHDLPPGYNKEITNIRVVPGYLNGSEPFGDAKKKSMLMWSPWQNEASWDYDIAVIELDRPIGALTGWYDYGFNADDLFFENSTFHTTGYPGELPYNGKYMYDMSGEFDLTWTHLLWHLGGIYKGQSGSGTRLLTGDGWKIYAVASKTDQLRLEGRHTRITQGKYDAIRNFVDDHTPSQYDLIPLDVNILPQTITAGSQLSSIDFLLHNYSAATWSGTVLVKVYLSTDNSISTNDTLIQTRSYNGTLGSKESQRLDFLIDPPTIPVTTPSGQYWIGILLEISDYDGANNNTESWDSASISVNAGSSSDTTPPTASWTSPSNNSTIQSRTVPLRANASDNSSGVNYVRFSAKYGGSWHNLYYDHSAPYEFNWDVCADSVPNGEIELGLQAYDRVNNEFVYSNYYPNYRIFKNYHCGSTPPPLPTGQVKLYNQTNFGGTPFWTGGVGDYGSLNPLKFTYSMEMPSGWSVKTYADYNFNGENRCWAGSVPKLSDHGWTAEVKSIQTYSSNVCGPPPNPGGQWRARFWRTATCYDDHSQCIDSNKTHEYHPGTPGNVGGRNYLIREDWGQNSPGGTTPNDEWSGYFDTTINFNPGHYVFYSTHDDGLKLKIAGYGEYQTSRDNREDNQQLCHNNGQSFYLNGNTRIEAYLREAGGDATIQIWYDSNTDACLPPALWWPGNQSALNNTTLTFDWLDKSGASEYQIQYADNINFSNSTERTTPSSSYTTDSALNYGLVYWKVRAKHPYGNWGPWSNAWQFTIAPSPPTNIYATDGTYANKIRIIWDAVPNASSYEVYRAASYNGEKQRLASVDTTSYSDGPVGFNTYYYWVTACNASVCSDYSNYDTGQPGVAAPTNIQASKGIYTDRVQITWNGSEGATNYEVWRNSSNNSSSATQLVASVSSVSYSDTSATVDTTYYYWVKAKNSYGSSNFSVSDSGYRGRTIPSSSLGFGGGVPNTYHEVVITSAGDPLDHLFKQTLLTDANGEYRNLPLSNCIEPGVAYDIYLKPYSYLRKKIASNITFNGPTLIDEFLPGFGIPVDIAGNDNLVGVSDLIVILTNWGQSPGGELQPGDINRDGQVSTPDLLLILQYWGTGDGWAGTKPLKCGIATFAPQAMTVRSGNGRITLAPENNTFDVGDTFDLEVLLDTGGHVTSGVDLVLLYDSGVLEAQSVNPSQLYPNVRTNSIDPIKGEIRYSADFDSADLSFQGNGTLGTVTFKVLRSISNTAVKVYYEEGETADTNIIEQDTVRDVLGHANTASFNIVGSPNRPLPTLSFTPSAGTVINSSLVRLDATPFDPYDQIKEVKFEVKLNGVWVPIGSDTDSPHWRFTWDASNILGGKYDLRATAFLLGNKGTTVTNSNVYIGKNNSIYLPLVLKVINPTVPNCVASTTTWQNFSLPSQTGTFTAKFDVTPNHNNMDGLTGLSAGSATAPTNLAAIVRFNAQGFIDARNGSEYKAVTQVLYNAGTNYRIRLVIRIPSHTYDVFVTSPNGIEQVIGTNFAFRSEQSGVTSLNNWALFANPNVSPSRHTVCNFTLSNP